MATFRIHEDLEKENRTISTAIPTKPIQNVLKIGDKRGGNVFGVLDNKQNNIKRNEIPLKPGTLKPTGDENIYGKHVVVGKIQPAAIHQPSKQIETATTIPLDQFKAFYVDENEHLNKNADNKENEPSVPEETCANTSTGAIRNPLCEIKEEAPMSVDKSFTPMSVDKSLMEENRLMVEPPLPKNDRERFFEIIEYQPDILEYLKEAESRNRPKPGYMKKQPDINQSMRTILIDWLVEVCEEYRLQTETLFLAVSYIDRFLSFMSVVRGKLQLVGTAAMFIAAKYEEIFPPDVAEFVYITDDTYTKKQVLRMEQLILKILSFDMTVPTAIAYINLYSAMFSLPEKVKFLTMYLSELALLNDDPYLEYTPSIISAAALALARHTLNMPMWTTELETTIGYSLMDLKTVVLQLHHSHRMAFQISQKAIQEKYKNSKHMEVGELNPCELDEQIFDEIVSSLIITENNSTTLVDVENREHIQHHNEDVRKMISSLIVGS